MKYKPCTPVLREISTFHGAEYNPRKMVPERLKQVAVSLSKLGFVLPIYVNKNGVILSGHQRTKAASLLGYTKIPVVEIDVPDVAEKGMNMVFNKGTNDMDTFKTDAKTAFETYLASAGDLTANLPDIPPDTFYPCMQMKQWDISRAINCAGADTTDSLRLAGQDLISAGAYMPLVVSGDRILNGRGRAFGYFSKSWDQVDVVEVPPEAADYAYLALNFLAMDFDIQANFKEELRYNAFRRRSVQAQIVGLSRTWTYFVYNRLVDNTRGKFYMLAGEAGNPDLMLLPTATADAKKKFQDKYGTGTIFDMGAGTLHDSKLMQEAGFDCVPFEPFYLKPDEQFPTAASTRPVINAYLDKMEELAAKGEGPTAIVSSFVLNSIPHHQDRVAYLTILAAMAKLSTGVFIGTQNTKSLQSNNLNTHLRLNGEEPNITLGTDSRFFKAQKFYFPDELKKLLEVFFAKVDIKMVESNVYAHCRYPKRPSAKLLKEAIELEFNMPYKEGPRLDLHERAKEVFSKYTGLDLS